MRRAVVSCAVIALGACTSFSSKDGTSTPSPDAGRAPDASTATPSATCAMAHESCEDFEEPSPPGPGWVPSDGKGISFGAAGAYAGTSMFVVEGGYPGTFLVHALAPGAKHVVCGAQVWLDAPPPAQGVELIRFDDGDGAIYVAVGPDGRVKLATSESSTMSGDATDSTVGLQIGNKWSAIVLEAQLQANQVSLSIDGISTSAPLKVGIQQITTVSVGLHADDSPTLPWSAKFDEIYCDVK